jgi:hypothetical protein
VYLTQEQPQELSTPANTNSYYEVSSVFEAKQLTIYSESCDNNPPPTLYLSKSVRHPNASCNEVKSEKFGDFTQRAVHSADPLNAPLHYIGLDLYEKDRFYSIYPWVLYENRPIPREEGKLQLGNMISPTIYQLIVPTAVGRGPFNYRVYRKILKEDEDLSNVNMETYCSIRRIGEFIGTINVPDEPRDPPRIYYNLVVESNTRYAVNVIVDGYHGVETAYKPLLIQIGKI